MLRRFSFAIGLALVLLVTSAAYAQGPVVRDSDPSWRASYWNNISLSGDPALEETVAHLDFDWGYSSPHYYVANEGFSARWKRIIDVEVGTYRFTATSDDGIRVYVDDRLIIDEWHDHPARTYTSDITLQAGHHSVKVEYYEMTGVAVARVSWAPISEVPNGWRGQYYDNRWLSGAPAVTRSDAKVDFEWGHGSPAAGIPSDGFSARWMRSVPFPVGTYRFTATSDDGIRVYVDQRLIIDEWRDQSARTFSTELALAGGPHEIVVEYYENAGVATAKVWWTPVSDGIRKWQGEYYDNRWLSGSPAVVRDDENVEFNWGYGSPSAGIPADGFSVRWTRTVRLESGMYRFTTTTDDGVRLWVNNHLLINQWRDQGATSHSGTIHVSGDVPIKMEYYENGGAASARLIWTRLGDEPPPPSGVVVVDNTDPGFRTGGSPSAWHGAQEGHGGSLIWTRNNDRLRPNYNWARWYPELEAGRYEVLVHIPEGYSTTGSARYWVSHRDGFTLRRVNQAANGGGWVSLGTYQFRGTGDEHVSLSDVTYELYLSRLIAFDAVKWVPR